MQPREPRPSRANARRSAAGPVRTVLRQAARVLMLLVLLVGAVAVSAGLADEATRPPATGAVATRPAPATSVADTQAAAASTARLLTAEDTRVLGLVRKVPYRGAAYRVETGTVDTVVLTARATPYDRAALEQLGALVPRNGVDYLRTSVLVAPGAKLFLTGDRPIRVRSDAAGFASIVAWKAELRLTGSASGPLSITSWAPGRRAADTAEGDGRAYIRTVGSRTEVRDVQLADLGFWSGRTGGLAMEGGDESVASAGAAAAAASSPIAGRTQVTVDDLVTRRLHYGLFTHDVSSGAVRRTTLAGSTLQGLLLHGKTHGLLIARTTVRGSGADGISLARGSRDLRLRGVVSEGNAGDGIRIDGRPTAARPTAGGGDPVPHGDVQVTGATLSDNVGSGAAVIGAVRVTITGSTLRGNSDGVTVRDDAADVRVADNDVSRSRGFGIGVTDGPTSVTVTGNTVDGSQTGIAVRSAVATVADNSVVDATEHGVSLAGRLPGSRVVENRIAGIGPTAVSTSRLTAPSTIVLSANDTTAWKVHTDQSWSQRLEQHPLLLLWLPILLVPLVGWVVTRRRRGAADRSWRRTQARLGVADSVTIPGPDHPAVLESGPATRTRVTVMS